MDNFLTTKNMLIVAVLVSAFGMMLLTWGVITTLLGIIFGFAGSRLLKELGY